MCGRKKPKMLDKSLRGTNDLEVIIYNLKKEIDRLNEEVQAKDIELKKLQCKCLVCGFMPLYLRHFQFNIFEHILPLWMM